MRFDSSAETQHQIRHTLSLDPRMLRFSVVKLGHKLGRPGAMHGALEDIGGKVEWTDSQQLLEVYWQRVVYREWLD